MRNDFAFGFDDRAVRHDLNARVAAPLLLIIRHQSAARSCAKRVIPGASNE
jgi:hypothetical protein